MRKAALALVLTSACVTRSMPPPVTPEEDALAHPAPLTADEERAWAEARDAVCPRRTAGALTDVAPFVRTAPPRGRWRTPASLQVRSHEELVETTPTGSPDRVPLRVATVDTLARAEWELVTRCALGLPDTAPPDAVRAETTALADAAKVLPWLRTRAEAHCRALAEEAPEVARRSRCHVFLESR